MAIANMLDASRKGRRGLQNGESALFSCLPWEARGGRETGDRRVEGGWIATSHWYILVLVSLWTIGHSVLQ